MAGDGARHLERQKSLNRETADSWAWFADHRAKVTTLVLEAIEPAALFPPSVCVLGAGNSNDLDLGRLVQSGAGVHLVDIDEEALAHGVARQLTPGAARLHHVELTGVAQFDPAISTCELVCTALAGPRLTLGPFNVVASSGLLTQLVAAAVDGLGADHPAVDETTLAIRTGHLRLMTRLLAPGGVAVLVTDVVSSDTLPALLEHHDPASLLRQALSTGNFFTGTHPEGLVRALDTDDNLVGRVDGVELTRPWRWRLSPSRAYLVVALTWRRAA